MLTTRIRMWNRSSGPQLRFIAVALYLVFLPFAHAASGSIEKATPQEFAAALEKEDALLLDVRTPEEIAEGKIPGASELDFRHPDFAKKLDRLQKDKTILVYCRSGGRSGEAAALLQEKGFPRIVDLAGGITAWKREQLPLDTGGARATDPNEKQKTDPAALAAELADGGPYLLNFSAEWCTPCRKMKPVLKELESERGSELRVLHIDVDADEALAERYQVEAVPTFVLFHDGIERWRKTGETTIETFTQALESLSD